MVIVFIFYFRPKTINGTTTTDALYVLKTYYFLNSSFHHEKIGYILLKMYVLKLSMQVNDGFHRINE